MVFKLKRQKEDERDFLFSAKVSTSVKLPKSADLRNDCPTVFNQGELGSCSANAGCANLVMLLKAPVTLSRLYMYYKERELMGTIPEDSGATMRDICKVAVKGVCEEKYMPYDITKFAQAPSVDAVKNATFKSGSYHSVRGLQEVKRVLAQDKHPVLIGMEIFESFQSTAVAKTGIMPMPKSGEENLGGHAVLVVGYDDKKQCLIVRNSWGANWGDKGYFYMPYQYVTKGYAFDFWELEL